MNSENEEGEDEQVKNQSDRLNSPGHRAESLSSHPCCVSLLSGEVGMGVRSQSSREGPTQSMST